MQAIKYLVFASLLVSCNSQKKEKDISSNEKETKVSPAMNCYEYATATDTIILKVIHMGDSITGTLVYSLKEKDRNTGTIQGSMKGDILVADYTFMSEGIQSIRKVAFKKKENLFIEGYGDFNNIDSLSYNSSMKLVAVACQ